MKVKIKLLFLVVTSSIFSGEDVTQYWISDHNYGF